MFDVKHDFAIHPKATAPKVYAKGYTLDDVYGSYSIEKARAHLTLCAD